MGFRVWDFRVLGCRVQVLGYRLQGLGFRAQVLGLGLGVGFRAA